MQKYLPTPARSDPPRLYSTDHLYLASFLVCKGAEVVQTKSVEGGRTYFLFRESEELHRATADFLGGGVVEARKFSFVILKLKKLIPRHARTY